MTEKQILEKLPKITSEEQYKEYEERAKKGEALIAGRWDSRDKKIQDLIEFYSFICGRILEYDQSR